MKELGDEIEFKSQISRLNGKWEEFYLKKAKKGIIVGIRTLSNGYVDIEYDDYGRTYKTYIPKEYFKAYLVAFNIYKKPIFVKI